MLEENHKPTILIVEDELGPRNALKVILRPFFDLQTVDNGHAALRAVKEGHIDLVTLDMKLPDRPGMELLQEIKAEQKHVEVVIITGYGSLQSAMDAIRYGAAAYLLKPFNVTELLDVINQTLGKRQRLSRLRQILEHPQKLWGPEQEATVAWRHLQEEYSRGRSKSRSDEGLSDYGEYVPLLSELLEAKNRDLFNHSSRTSFYSGLLGKHLHLTETEQRVLAIGAFLHDLGHIALGNRVIRKPACSEDTETDLFKRHPEIGARMVLPLNAPAEVGQILLYHHERYDGAGYPYGLQGEGIPLLARIVGIAQAFDHMTTAQPTHPALCVQDALTEIRHRAGTEFDPHLADIFIRAASECAGSLPSLAAASRPAVLSES